MRKVLQLTGPWNIRKGRIRVLIVLAGIGAGLLLSGESVHAQSTRQEAPTAVTTNEVSGVIKPRDIGDSRLTTYFYTFEGVAGDIFVNVVTKNFNGDIDIFTAEGLRPLTKIVIYASDAGESETGRVVYLRKPEKLLMRVEGRTPGDDPASFRVKFAGSFQAVAPTEEIEEPRLPEVVASNESGIRVNSVGTIIEVIPKKEPPAETIAEAVPPAGDALPEKEPEPDKPAEEPPAADSVTEKADAPSKVEVIITDNLAEPAKAANPATTEPATPRRRSRRSTRRTAPAKPVAETQVSEDKAPAKVPEKSDPMANIHLVVVLKDGGKVERVMSDILRFSVDRGVLTIIFKNGRIGRYSMLDVAKVTIE